MATLCSIDWAALGTWAAVAVALWLPFYERRDQRKLAFERQRAALIATSESVVETIDSLHRRAAGNSLMWNERHWIADEASAAVRITQEVNLSSLCERSLVDPSIDLQRAARTAERRLRRDIDNAEEGKTIPLKPGDYQEPLDLAQAALQHLRTAKRG